jgi:tRNA (guanine-N7-)-methyltransferase
VASGYNHGVKQPVATGAPSLIHQFETILERMDIAKLFPATQPLEVELGCGDASFLIEHARLNQQTNFLGVERLMGRVNKVDRKGRRLNLTNVRGVRIESAYLLEYLLPANCARALHIYFPDPWPKKKHRRFRLINERFTTLAFQALSPGGIVYLRTDDEDYFAQMLEVFAADKRFCPVETPSTLAAVVTDFERDFNAKGIPTQRAAYQRG